MSAPAMSSTTHTTATGSALPRAERRLVLAAFLSLFGILCAQTLMETARDALFLTRIPIGVLPWVYLALAVLSVVAAAVSPGDRRRGGSRATAISLLVGSAVTAGLGVALAGAGRVVAVYGLFLWSGIFSAFTVTRVWTVLAETLDMSLAKRIYGRLAAGGGLGAVTGAGLARLLSDHVAPHGLVLLAALVVAATALGPALALRGPVGFAGPEDVARRRPRASAGRRQAVRAVAHPYVTRLVLAALLAAAVSTLLDFSFKQAVVARVSAARLPAFFATFHLATSALSLVVQVFGVGLVIRLAGVRRGPLIIPALLLVGMVLTAVSGGLVALILLRGLDAALRNSIHRPTFELLQVPLGDRLRRRAKPLIDGVGLRGGQAVAALGLLLPLGVAAGNVARLVAVAVLMSIWTVVAFGLGRRYVDLLRVALLRTGAAATSAASATLDADALATLVAALDSPREAEVLAALDLLAAHGPKALLPARLLDHPSAAVVRRTVELLDVGVLSDRAGARIRDLLPLLDGLLGHADVTVRTTALRRRLALDPDRAQLRRLAHGSGCAAVRAVAQVALIDRGFTDRAPALAAVRALVAAGGLGVRRAVADTLANHPSPRLLPILLDLAAAREPEVLGPVAGTLGALGALGGDAALEALVSMLGRREGRAAARQALARIPGAFPVLAAVLVAADRPLAVRASVPRALVEIDPERAVSPLLDGLLLEEDAFLRFRILRALNRVRRARPRVAFDEDILGRAAAASVRSAYRYLAWRVYLDAGAARLPVRRTATWELLRDLLAEKEENAVERLFRVLSLRYPHEDFRRLLRALRTGSRRVRAAGHELIENLLAGPARVLTLALVEDAGDRARLAAMAPDAPSHPPRYRDLLAAIVVEEAGGTLAALAARHAAELAATAELIPPAAGPRSAGALAAGAVDA